MVLCPLMNCGSLAAWRSRNEQRNQLRWTQQNYPSLFHYSAMVPVALFTHTLFANRIIGFLSTLLFFRYSHCTATCRCLFLSQCRMVLLIFVILFMFLTDCNRELQLYPPTRCHRQHNDFPCPNRGIKTKSCNSIPIGLLFNSPLPVFLQIKSTGLRVCVQRTGSHQSHIIDVKRANELCRNFEAGHTPPIQRSPRICRAQIAACGNGGFTQIWW